MDLVEKRIMESMPNLCLALILAWTEVSQVLYILEIDLSWYYIQCFTHLYFGRISSQGQCSWSRAWSMFPILRNPSYNLSSMDFRFWINRSLDDYSRNFWCDYISFSIRTSKTIGSGYIIVWDTLNCKIQKCNTDSSRHEIDTTYLNIATIPISVV